MTGGTKPSEWIVNAARDHLERTSPPVRDVRDVEIHEARAVLRFILQHLDAEQERRQAFERDVLTRLTELERQHAPGLAAEAERKEWRGSHNQVGGFPPHMMCAHCSGPCAPLTCYQNASGTLFCGKECFEADRRNATAPLCLDGTRVHDLQGKARCRCGYVPPLVRTMGAYEPDEPTTYQPEPEVDPE